MSGRSRYYISRALLSIAFGCLWFITGGRWWIAAVATVVTFGSFVWAPLSGRYVVDEGSGGNLLRRDERSAAISGQAARNGWVATIIALGAIVTYFGLIAETDIPVVVVSAVLVIGSLVYWMSDLWLRRV